MIQKLDLVCMVIVGASLYAGGVAHTLSFKQDNGLDHEKGETPFQVPNCDR